MKDQLENELVIALTPYLKDLNGQDLKLRISMVLADYDVSRNERALTVYEGDINEMILMRFLSAKIAQGCSKRTIAYYGNSVRASLEQIGKPYNDVTAEDIRLYLAKRIYKDKVSKTTTNNERRNLSAFYSWLQREEILLKNPMTKVDAVKVTKAKKKAFEPLEIERIRDACRSRRETAMVEVLLSTWARVSEVTHIRIDDIHDDHLIVHGKGDKDREVYLNAKAVLAVQNYLAERNDNNPYLFPHARFAGDITKFASNTRRKKQCEWYKEDSLVDVEQPMDHGSLERVIRSIGKRAGVSNTHPHRFRRTGATTALRNGMPLIQVSKLLGHENIGTTQIYLDVSDEELAQAHKRYVV